jgi:hypothetical protein
MHDYVAPFREVAAHFGLQLQAPSEGVGSRYVVVVLDGMFEGVPVHVYRATSYSDARWTYVWVSARRNVPGDLGLAMGLRAPARAFFAKLFGADLVRVGSDDHFDDVFALEAPEPDRVRTFLRPELRFDLLQWHRELRADAARHKSALWGIWADDEHVFIELQPEAWTWKMYDREVAIDELTNALRAVSSLARSFDAAMAVTPPSGALEFFTDVLRRFAEPKGLAMSTSPLATWGRIGDADVTIRAVTTNKGRHSIAVRRAFAKPLPFFVRVKPGRWYDFYTWDAEGPHERIDDKEFDAEFTIISSDVVATRSLLTSAARTLLLELHHGDDDVLLDTTGVVVKRDELGEGALDHALARAETLAKALGR